MTPLEVAAGGAEGDGKEKKNKTKKTTEDVSIAVARRLNWP